MKEESLFLDSGGFKIQGLLSPGRGKGAVVIAHPHPLYGGDMNNPVVLAVARAYQGHGYATLRFNFRGVGASEGAYDEGRGEQEDVRAAVSYLREMGETPIDLAGYSFGAWVNAQAASGPGPGETMEDTQTLSVRSLILVSPPVSVLDFSFLKENKKIALILTGDRDDIAPPAMVQQHIPLWNRDALFTVISDADHFYWGRTGQIEEILSTFLQKLDRKRDLLPSS